MFKEREKDREREREREGKGMMVRERLKKWLVIERADFRFVRFDLDLEGNKNKIKSREKNSLRRRVGHRPSLMP